MTWLWDLSCWERFDVGTLPRVELILSIIESFFSKCSKQLTKPKPKLVRLVKPKQRCKAKWVVILAQLTDQIACITRSIGFESSHWPLLFGISVTCAYKNVKNKEKRPIMVHFKQVDVNKNLPSKAHKPFFREVLFCQPYLCPLVKWNAMTLNFSNSELGPSLQKNWPISASYFCSSSFQKINTFGLYKIWPMTGFKP